MSMFQDGLPPNRPRGIRIWNPFSKIRTCNDRISPITLKFQYKSRFRGKKTWRVRIWLVFHGILNLWGLVNFFELISDTYVKNTCDIWLLGKKTRRIRIWLVFLGIFYFCWVFPDFIDKNMQNTNDTCFLGKKMRRSRIWPLFLRIFNLWGSFLGIVTSVWKIQMIHVFWVKNMRNKNMNRIL